jgi:hypothetical protein
VAGTPRERRNAELTQRSPGHRGGYRPTHSAGPLQSRWRARSLAHSHTRTHARAGALPTQARSRAPRLRPELPEAEGAEGERRDRWQAASAAEGGGVAGRRGTVAVARDWRVGGDGKRGLERRRVRTLLPTVPSRLLT